MGEWVEKSLGELIDIRHGYAFAGKGIHDQPTGDILLTPGNFTPGGGFKADKFKYYEGEVPEAFILSEGDLLVSMTDLSKNADTLGFPAFVPVAPEGHRFLHNQRLGRVEIRSKESADRRFLHYLLCSQQYRHEVLASSSGTTVKHTSPDRIKRYRFPCPPLDEQQRIGHGLGLVDDKIELNRRMNRTLEQTARATFKSWFVDFDPVRTAAIVPDDIRRLFPDRLVDSPIGPIPEGWEVRPVGELVHAVGGATPSTSNPEYWGGDVPFVTPRDLSRLSAAVILSAARAITAAGLGRISSGLLDRGTVVLSSRAPIGYLAISEVAIAVNQGIIAFPPSKSTLPSVFIFHWLATHMEEIIGNANGTTFLEISKKNFRPILCVKPPATLLARFCEVAEPIHQKIAANQRESQTLVELRDTLLPKLISGEIRVGKEQEAQPANHGNF